MSGEHEHPEYDQGQEVINLSEALTGLADALTGLIRSVSDLRSRVEDLERTDHSHTDPEPLFPGQPPEGKFLIGATTKYHGYDTGNPLVDPYLKYEQPTGLALSTYRSYASPAQWSNDQNLRNIITRDVAAGRIPMPSWKTPNSRTWTQMASGAEDARMDDILQFLAGFAPHPIHAILHHEPDNVNNNTKGTPADHIAMNARFRQRMEASGVTNVSLHLNIIGYMFNSAAARSNPTHPRYMDNWWNPEVYDFVSFDPYAHDLEDPVLGRIEDWCGQNNAKWMIAEWGYKDGWHGASRDWSKQDVLDFHQRLRDNPLCFGSQVWDSDQNGHDYFVTTDQLEAIHELMERADTYRWTP